MVLLHVIEKGLESKGTRHCNFVVDCEVLGQAFNGTAHDWVKLFRLVLLNLIGLREEEQWQR